MIAPNEPIRLVVGLGNPGAKYERTRHNAGFWFVDALARAEGKSLSSDKKFFGEAGRLSSDCWTLKPGTFMNRSGQAVAALAGFYQIDPLQILVVHDELDLKPGEVPATAQKAPDAKAGEGKADAKGGDKDKGGVKDKGSDKDKGGKK